MSIVSYSTVPGSDKSAHQYVEINDRPVGEVWREKVLVSGPRNQRVERWRWFARTTGATKAIASGVLSKDKAVDALEAAIRDGVEV